MVLGVKLSGTGVSIPSAVPEAARAPVPAGRAGIGVSGGAGVVMAGGGLLLAPRVGLPKLDEGTGVRLLLGTRFEVSRTKSGTPEIALLSRPGGVGGNEGTLKGAISLRDTGLVWWAQNLVRAPFEPVVTPGLCWSCCVFH